MLHRLGFVGLLALWCCLRAASAPADWPFDAKEAQRRQAEAAKGLGLPVEYVVELAKGVPMILTLIPAGAFDMGRQAFPASAPEVMRNQPFTAAELPVHRVEITRPFYLGKYEVTQAQWQALLGDNPSMLTGNARLPVEMILWEEAVTKFLPALQQKLPKGWRCRLPSEAEWEYACRAGTDTAYYFGGEITLLQVNTSIGNRAITGKPLPVGSFPPNAWGLYDMLGNVWEFCADYYDPAFYARSPLRDPLCTVKPEAFATVEGHVLRGGSANYNDFYCRAAHRGWAGEENVQGNRYEHRGIRVVVEFAGR